MRGGAVWQVAQEGLSQEMTFAKIPAGKGSHAEGAATAGKERGGMLNWLRSQSHNRG